MGHNHVYNIYREIFQKEWQVLEEREVTSIENHVELVTHPHYVTDVIAHRVNVYLNALTPTTQNKSV
jgi:hypothetical protein